ncbi:MAG: hypothetical protein QME59_02050 [Candidatus Hydrothermarchaeota archaeon]|nr:hypothetical protein [Candidatus Hydrothermarchaeota archaeon]
MDLEKILEVFERNNIKFNILVENKKILEIRPKGKNIDIEIFNIEDAKKLIKGLKWRD